MPKILDRLVSQLMAKGKSKDAAYAIAVASLQKSGNLKKDSTEATPKGERRGKMTAGERAIDRERKYSKDPKPKSSYSYNRKTNRARLKKRNG